MTSSCTLAAAYCLFLCCKKAVALLTSLCPDLTLLTLQSFSWSSCSYKKLFIYVETLNPCTGWGQWSKCMLKAGWKFCTQLRNKYMNYTNIYNIDKVTVKLTSVELAQLCLKYWNTQCTTIRNSIPWGYCDFHANGLCPILCQWSNKHQDTTTKCNPYNELCKSHTL